MTTKPEWQDATSYSRGDKDRKPTAWLIKSGNVDVCITSAHIYYPGEWIMHCRALGIDTKPLGVKTLAEAKAKALSTAKDTAARILNTLIEMDEGKYDGPF